MRRIDRFDKYLSFKNLNDNKVTVQLGLTVGTIGKSRKEGRDLSDKVVAKILKFYTDLSRVWLLTGEGSMLVTGDQSAPVQTVSGNGTTAVQGNGNQVNSETARFLSLLEKKDEQISKKDEQIDRLLSLLELKSKSEK